MTLLLAKYNFRFCADSDSYQLLAVVVALNNAVVGDADGHDEHVRNGTGTQGVNHDGQYASTCWRQLSAARTCAL